jgi:fatty aldehyde-generating acyl-ACP reductase
MIPYLRPEPPWFAFLVHLRSTRDADRVGVGRFVRRYSRDGAEFERRLQAMPPVVSSEIRFRSSAARGEVICINRLPGRMIGAEARGDVLAAVRLAACRGARVVGLGALTSPATGGGLTIIDELPRGVTLTNGNALTAAIVRRNVRAAAHAKVGTSARDVVVAVVGCTGSVGSALSRLLASEGYRLILIGRQRARVERDFGDLSSVVASESLFDVRQADIVVLLTNDRTALISPTMPRVGSVVIDCSQPANIPRTSYSEFTRRSITVLEGGVVRIPDYSSTDDFGLMHPTDTFACLAEAYVVARAGLREHQVGRRSPDDALRLERLATRYGIEPRPFHELERYVAAAAY